LFERELRGQREGGVAQARKVEAGDVMYSTVTVVSASSERSTPAVNLRA